MQYAQGATFQGTSRYAILRRLGAGGSGIVYEAFDRERQCKVALKTLALSDPEALYRFKREFRALSDVSHPNLVTLHELVVLGDTVFFTMELITGVDLLAYVWRGDGDVIRRALQKPQDPTTVRAGARGLTPDLGEGSADAGPLSARRHVVVDYDRLRGALAQLALGVTALHNAGLLHRDIKLSNILMTGEDRLVLLDFGIATELYAPSDRLDPATLVGTPEYMAPEQGALEPLTTAADWYAVGVVLYKVLTGRAPFVGAPLRVLLEKQRVAPPPPSQLAADVPADLDALAMRLLARAPEERATGAEVLAALGVPDRRSTPAVRLRSSPSMRIAAPAPRLLGRDAVLTELRRALADVTRGQGRAVLVLGASGIGKTATVRSFLDEASSAHGALVLTGQCFERETVAFKALDGIVDELSRHLLQLAPKHLAQVLPEGAAALGRLFPVLERVRGVGGAAPAVVPHPGPAQRHRAAGALRGILENLSKERPVVLFIDDLQWGDRDSVHLLHDTLNRGGGVPVLFIAAYRRDEGDGSPAVRATVTRWGSRAQRLALPPLSSRDLEVLALELLGEGWPGAEALARQIARESQGMPYLAMELVRFVQSRKAPLAPDDVKLTAALRERIDELAPAARGLLTLLAVAGAPLPGAVALRAAGLDPLRSTAHLTALKLAGLARPVPGEGNLVDCMHEALRDELVRPLGDGERRQLHGLLADALEHAAEPAPEQRFVHLRAAGRKSEAAEHALYAARRAVQNLAFEHGAALLAAVLELRVLDADEEREVRVELGDALAGAGRGAAAADAFLAAAQEAPPARRGQLTLRAAEELFLAGYPQRGLLLLRGLPEEGKGTPAGALRTFTAGARRLLGRLGTGAKEVDTDAPLAEELDLALAAAFGLWTDDAAVARSLAARTLVAAERMGDAARSCRALCLEGFFAALFGEGKEAGAEARLERARSHAERADRGEASLLVRATGAAVHLLRGEPRRAHEPLSAALDGLSHLEVTGVEPLTRRGVGRSMVRWEVDTFRWLRLSCLAALGRFAEMEVEASRFYDEGEARADRYVTTSLQLGEPFLRFLARDDLAAAGHALDAAAMGPRSSGREVRDLLVASARVDLLLYTGDGAGAARARLPLGPGLPARDAGAYAATLSAHLSLRSSLAEAAALPEGEARRGHLRQAERHVESLARAEGALPRTRARLGLAAVHALRGDVPGRAAALGDAVTEARRGELPLLVALGEALASPPRERGRAVAAALEPLGIARPVAFAEVLAPGLAPRS